MPAGPVTPTSGAGIGVPAQDDPALATSTDAAMTRIDEANFITVPSLLPQLYGRTTHKV